MHDVAGLDEIRRPRSSIPEAGHGRTAQLIDLLDPIEDFNFRHFRMRHMAAELLREGGGGALRSV